MSNYNDQHHGEEDFYGSQGSQGGQKVQPKSLWKRHPLLVVSIVLGILLVIFASTTVYLLTNRSSATPTTTVIKSSTAAIASPTPTATAPVDTTTPTTTDNSTPTTTNTANTPGTQATVAASTFTEPNGGLRLHTNADDPIIVTITSMKYDPANNRMLWYLTLKNIDSADHYVINGSLSLQSDLAGDAQDAHQANITSQSVSIPAGTQVQETSVFTFVPYQKASGVTYTLTTSINVNYASIALDPVQLTF